MTKLTEITSRFLADGINIKFDAISGVNTNFSPGAGVVFTFGAADAPRAEQYVLGYHRPNPDANNILQVCIAIGGKVDKGQSIALNLKNNIAAKTNWAEIKLSEYLNLEEPKCASVYNHDSGEGWDMSYLYLTQHVTISFQELKDMVNAINAKAAAKLAEDPSSRVNVFELYKFTDVLDIINRNAKLEENKKVGRRIVNQLTGALDDVIIFDDYATKVLFQNEVLTVKQTVDSEELNRRCNSAVLFYTDGHVVLQGNIKDVPQWASVGGKVEVLDKSQIVNFDLLDSDSLEGKLVTLLRNQFAADKDPIMATFAYAAIREAVEEIGGNNKDFIYNALINKQATLVRVDRDSFGIPEKNKKFWTEQFYLDFGDMPIAELMLNLKASGKKDCTKIVAAPIAELQTVDGDKPGMLTNTFFNGLLVRHTTATVAKQVDALRKREEKGNTVRTFLPRFDMINASTLTFAAAVVTAGLIAYAKYDDNKAPRYEGPRL